MYSLPTRFTQQLSDHVLLQKNYLYSMTIMHYASFGIAVFIICP